MKVLKEMKWNSLLMAVLYVVAGVILILYPETTAKNICYVGAAVAVIFGIINIVGYFLRDVKIAYYQNDFIYGLIQILLGIFIIYKVELIVELVPFILGIIVVISGFCKLQAGIDMKRMGFGTGAVFLVISIVNIILGIVLICDPFGAAKVLFMVIGAGLIFSGVTDFFATIFLSVKLNKYEKMGEAGMDPYYAGDVAGYDIPPYEDDRNPEMMPVDQLEAQTDDTQIPYYKPGEEEAGTQESVADYPEHDDIVFEEDGKDFSR